MDSVLEKEFRLTMKKYPCMFNMEETELDTQYKRRLQEREMVLTDEIDYEEEIHKLNLYTWLVFKLEHQKPVEERNFRVAERWNDIVLKRTDWENMVAVGNRAFLMRYMGKSSEMSINQLKLLAQQSNANELIGTAKAEQGYAYLRLGGEINLKLAIDHYEAALRMLSHDNRCCSEYKYTQGLALIRSLHPNWINSKEFSMNWVDRYELGVRRLNEVAKETSSNVTKGKAYCQLALIKSYLARQDASNILEELFHNVSPKEQREKLKSEIKGHCKTATEFVESENNHKVYADCGRALMFAKYGSDEDEYYVLPKQMLEKSIAIKENKKAYHWLGKLHKKVGEHELFLHPCFSSLKLSNYTNKPAVTTIYSFLKNQKSDKNGFLRQFFISFYSMPEEPKENDVLIVYEIQKPRSENSAKYLEQVLAGFCKLNVYLKFTSNGWEQCAKEWTSIIIILENDSDDSAPHKLQQLLNTNDLESRIGNPPLLALVDKCMALLPRVQRFHNFYLTDLLKDLCGFEDLEHPKTNKSDLLVDLEKLDKQNMLAFIIALVKLIYQIIDYTA